MAIYAKKGEKMSAIVIIDTKVAADALRQIADKLESGEFRLIAIEHQVWEHRKHEEWVNVKVAKK